MKWGALFFLIACGIFWVFANRPSDLHTFERQGPPFVFEEFFSGPVKGWGVVESPFRHLRSRFTIDLQTTWESQKCQTQAMLEFDDHTRPSYTWHFMKKAPHVFEGISHATGQKIRVQSTGPVAVADYLLQIPFHNQKIACRCDHRMYMIDSETLITHIRLVKWGLTVGHVTLALKRQNVK